MFRVQSSGLKRCCVTGLFFQDRVLVATVVQCGRIGWDRTAQPESFEQGRHCCVRCASKLCTWVKNARVQQQHFSRASPLHRLSPPHPCWRCPHGSLALQWGSSPSPSHISSWSVRENKCSQPVAPTEFVSAVWGTAKGTWKYWILVHGQCRHYHSAGKMSHPHPLFSPSNWFGFFPCQLLSSNEFKNSRKANVPLPLLPRSCVFVCFYPPFGNCHKPLKKSTNINFICDNRIVKVVSGRAGRDNQLTHSCNESEKKKNRTSHISM